MYYGVFILKTSNPFEDFNYIWNSTGVLSFLTFDSFLKANPIDASKSKDVDVSTPKVKSSPISSLYYSTTSFGRLMPLYRSVNASLGKDEGSCGLFVSAPDTISDNASAKGPNVLTYDVLWLRVAVFIVEYKNVSIEYIYSTVHVISDDGSHNVSPVSGC